MAQRTRNSIPTITRTSRSGRTQLLRLASQPHGGYTVCTVGKPGTQASQVYTISARQSYSQAGIPVGGALFYSNHAQATFTVVTPHNAGVLPGATFLQAYRSAWRNTR